MTKKKDEEFESTKQHETNKSKMKAEAAEQKQATEAEVDRLAENQEIAQFQGLPVAGETRDQLLERIRKLREHPEPTEPELFRSEGLQKEFDAEQAAGRAAVAKAEAQREKYQALLTEEAKGEKNQAG